MWPSALLMALALLLSLVAVSSDEATQAPGSRCQGLADLPLMQCCAADSYADMSEKSAALLAMREAEDWRPVGDMAAAELVRQCYLERHEFAHGPCEAYVRKRRLLISWKQNPTCALPPFSETHELIGRGWLPQPPPPSQEKMQECQSKRYLLWTRNPSDYFAGHSHKRFSMVCALWEAHRLNRTLVVDSFTGMDRTHSGTGFNVEVQYRAWYNTRALQQLPAGFVFYHDFLQGCGQLGVYEEGDDGVAVVPSGTSQEHMEAHARTPLLVRDWHRDRQIKPALSFGFEVCHRSASAPPDQPQRMPELGVDYTVPNQFWDESYADWVATAADRMLHDMRAQAGGGSANVVCLHIRRGDKITNLKGKYPNLGYETSPEGVRAAIAPHVPRGATLFLATNERRPLEFFAPLGDTYQLRSVGSFDYILRLSEFVPATLALVDYALLARCQKMIPTFASEKSRGFAQLVSLSASVK